MSIWNAHENTGKAHLRTFGDGVVDGPGFLEHIGEREPEGCLDLFEVDREALISCQIESVRSDHERRSATRSPDDVIELPEIFGIDQIDTDLLEGFALCRAPCRIICGLHATTGKRHMAGPRIALSLSAFDQEHFDRMLALPKHDGHGSMGLRRQVGLIGFMGAQSFSKEVNLHAGRA